jgi:hypothetical protein
MLAWNTGLRLSEAKRSNASSSDEKIRTVTVPEQTLERGKGRTKSPRQSKNKTATGKSKKSVAIKSGHI